MKKASFTIAYDVSILEDDHFTGVEKLAYYLFRELWEITPGWRHLLFCRKAPPRFADLPSNVDRCPVSGGRLWRYWHLPRAINKSGADIFISPVTALPGPCGCPLVAYVHECQWRYAVGEKKGGYHKWMFRLAAWRSKILLTNSAKTKMDIYQELPFKAHPQVDIVSPSADPAMVSGPVAPLEPLLDKLSVPAGVAFCIAVGTIRAKKNIEIMLQAFARPDMRDIHLILAGRVDNESFIEAASKQGLKNIHFAGYLKDPEIKSLYQSALALIYISANEGFGLTLLEAFANDCPAISSKHGAIPEIGGEGALLLEKTVPGELAQAILRLRRMPEMRKHLVQKGKVQLEKYSWAQSAERLRRIIQNQFAANDS
ncbi:MAG: glycosyltransferase family 1 protein [Lentisphaeria bacterium]|nr:glycosyltransferase family 1 protein [Lentisphaeria bacterium]